MAATQHHSLVFENDHVRVVETRIPAGETTRVHTHPWPAMLHFLTRRHVVRRDHRGQVIFDSRTVAPSTPVTASWTGPFPPHTLENVGDCELRVVAVEIKQT